MLSPGLLTLIVIFVAVIVMGWAAMRIGANAIWATFVLEMFVIALCWDVVARAHSGAPARIGIGSALGGAVWLLMLSIAARAFLG